MSAFGCGVDDALHVAHATGVGAEVVAAVANGLKSSLVCEFGKSPQLLDVGVDIQLPSRPCGDSVQEAGPTDYQQMFLGAVHAHALALGIHVGQLLAVL